MKYHYEAVPVLFNILLFFLMLYPFPNVYRYGCEFRKRYTDILDYAVYGVLLILFCTFGYADNDFYHYEGLFKRICSTGLNVHLEPVYYLLVDTECHFKLSGMAVYSVERNGDFVVMDNKTAQT